MPDPLSPISTKDLLSRQALGQDWVQHLPGIWYQAALDMEDLKKAERFPLHFLFVSESIQEIVFPLPAQTKTLEALWFSRVHPEDRGRVLESFMLAHSKGVAWKVDFRVRNKDDQWRMFRNEARCLEETHHCSSKENEIWVGSMQDVTDLYDESKKLEQRVFFDALTGLPNRAYLDQSLKQEEWIKNPSLHVLFLDLDKFKSINDMHGHHAGDALLQKIAECLKHEMPSSALIVRQSGDEFVILLKGFKSDQVEWFCVNLLEALGQPQMVMNRSMLVTVSIGIASQTSDAAFDGAMLLRQADLAMYQAKAQGRNRFLWFDERTEDCIKEQAWVEQALRKAILNKQLTIDVQPQWNLIQGVCSGMEVLARWNDPEKGSIPPTWFIPVAEDLGLIHELGWQILEQALLLRNECKTLLEDHVRVAVNISTLQLMDQQFVEGVARRLKQYNVPAHWLELEITEQSLIKDIKAARRSWMALQEMGIRISIDDFGRGFSNLELLHDFSINKIKLDRKFITGIEEEKARNLCKAVIQLGQSMNIKVLGEGVEQTQHSVILQDLGCEEGQGFLWAKPMSAKALMHWLESLELQQAHPLS